MKRFVERSSVADGFGPNAPIAPNDETIPMKQPQPRSGDSCPEVPAEGPPQRRSFLTRLLTLAAGAVAILPPLSAAVGMVLSPLRSYFAPRTKSSDLVALDLVIDAVPADGTPVRIVVYADREDGWNFHQQQPLGAVWLRRTSEDTVQALSSICPHLGCSVDFRPGARDFFCPCHTSTFDLDGRRLNQIPPRDMDELEVASRDGRLYVRYARFRGGIAEKVAL